MRNHFFVYIVLFLSIVHGCSEMTSCTSEDEAIDLFTKQVQDAVSIDQSIINICVERSWWSLGATAAEYFLKKNIDINNIYEESVREKNIQIRKLQSYLNSKRTNYAVISPAYQWAEGRDELAFNIKLAHKWDAPATLGCDDITVNITSSNVVMIARCPSTSKVFKLDFKLWGEVIPEECVWSKAAVSRVNINLKKAVRGKWDNLFIDGYNVARNAHTWYSMQDSITKADQEKIDEENVAIRLEERKKEKELNEEEERKMEERKKKMQERKKRLEEKKRKMQESQ